MAIGPLLLPPPVFAFLVGVIFLMILGALLKKYSDPRFDTWTGIVIVMAFLAARLGFVISHWETYQNNPLRIVYIWQGGFDIKLAVVAALLSVLYLKGWRHRSIGLGALGVTALSIVIAYGFTSKPTAHDLPDFVFQSIDNESVTLSEHSGDLLVLNLWATWCAPCRREMPVLEQAIKNYPHIQFYFINQGESEQLVQDFLKEESLEINDVVFLDQSYELSTYYQTLGTPVTLFFKKNTLVAQHMGEISPEVLSDRLKRLQF